MAQLAKVPVISAPACPSCRNRLTQLPLDDLFDDPNYQCPFCGEHMRMPRQILEKLFAEREELEALHAAENESLWDRFWRGFFELFGL